MSVINQRHVSNLAGKLEGVQNISVPKSYGTTKEPGGSPFTSLGRIFPCRHLHGLTQQASHSSSISFYNTHLNNMRLKAFCFAVPYKEAAPGMAGKVIEKKEVVFKKKRQKAIWLSAC